MKSWGGCREFLVRATQTCLVGSACCLGLPLDANLRLSDVLEVVLITPWSSAESCASSTGLASRQAARRLSVRRHLKQKGSTEAISRALTRCRLKYQNACDDLLPQQGSDGSWGSSGTPPIGRRCSVVRLQLGYGIDGAGGARSTVCPVRG